MRALIAFALVLLAVLPARASEPGWTGRWNTRWRDGGAQMELMQQGNRITGSYPHPFQGVHYLMEPIIDAKSISKALVSAEFYFVISSGSSSPVRVPGTMLPRQARKQPPSGRCLLKHPERGGSYPAYGGQIEGEVTGRELRGRWIEGKRTGGLSFVLAPNGQSFMGRFDTGEWWTGGGVQPGLREVAVNQTGARQALRTFVLAGNAAQAGNPDEWAKAAAVTDFGDTAASIAPRQKLAADERADKTALMLGVLRLAGWMRVRLGDLDYATPELGAAAE